MPLSTVACSLALSRHILHPLRSHQVLKLSSTPTTRINGLPLLLNHVDILYESTEHFSEFQCIEEWLRWRGLAKLELNFKWEEQSGAEPRCTHSPTSPWCTKEENRCKKYSPPLPHLREFTETKLTQLVRNWHGNLAMALHDTNYWSVVQWSIWNPAPHVPSHPCHYPPRDWERREEDEERCCVIYWCWVDLFLWRREGKAINDLLIKWYREATVSNKVDKEKEFPDHYLKTVSR